MAGSPSNLIAFPPDLIAAAEQYAKEAHRSVDEVAEEALRFYVNANPQLNALRQFHKERAASLGLSSDEYVVKLVKEDRAAERERLQSA